jgi:excisionase family DNA binding protein
MDNQRAISPPTARSAGSHLLKPTEVARRLGVSRTWLYAAAKDGRIPSIRIGGPDGPVRFVAEDLEAWLDEARAAWRPGDSSAATLRRMSEAA